jgi:hypothetical protein
MNSATRLHELITEFKNIKDKKNVRQAIADVFELEDIHCPEVFQYYVSIINLALDVKGRLSAITEINSDLYLRSINNIQNALSTINLNQDLDTFKAKFKSEDLHGLEFISDQLDKIESEENISEEQLHEFEKKIDKLIDEVRSAELDIEFTHFLVSHLFLIRMSIQNYRFFGSTGLRASLSRVVGEILLDPGEATKNEKKRGFISKTLSAMKDINTVLVFFRNGSRVANQLDIQNLLNLPGG